MVKDPIFGLRLTVKLEWRASMRAASSSGRALPMIISRCSVSRLGQSSCQPFCGLTKGISSTREVLLGIHLALEGVTRLDDDAVARLHPQDQVGVGHCGVVVAALQRFGQVVQARPVEPAPGHA